MASADDQIRALLEGRAFDFACRELGVTNMEHHDYAEVFTVTLAEIDRFVETHGLLKSRLHASPSPQDGVYMVKEHLIWRTYYQERGIKFDEEGHLTRAAAIRASLNSLLGLSGTGLRF